MAKALSTSEARFLRIWRQCGPEDSEPVAQYQTLDCLTPARRKPYTWDFAWPACRVLVEIQGFGGGHSRPARMHADARKHRAALAAGYVVITATSLCLRSDKAEQTIHEIMAAVTAAGRWGE